MPARSDRDPSRVHWMELFFDLIFVALVGQLAHVLREHPTLGTLFLFFALFASVWWSWVNLTFTVNVMPRLTRRQLSLVMLAAMVGVGAIAVAAPEAVGDRAWLFAAGNGMLRVVLLGLWIRRSWNNGRASRVRVLVYNGVTAALWIASIWLPHPFDFVLWAVAIVLEVTLLVASSRSWPQGVLAELNVEHLSERFGLLVIIVLGESVLTTVAALDTAWTVLAGVTAALGLVVASCLAWSFFIYGVDAMRSGLGALLAAGNVGAIRDTVGFLPFLLVAGVTIISGALSIAIAHPADPLPPASALSFGGGIALFYFTNAVISRRFGGEWPAVLRWAAPAVGLPIVLVFAGLVLPAGWTTVCAVAILAFVVTSTELSTRRRAASAGAVGGLSPE
ncbi:MAG TPA: low temperature requirement protein A [Leifsonia sp.]|jgi:low temperature requirement protein LtrA|nr:low temperature requirement protein A [Leifsonia sp.]